VAHLTVQLREANLELDAKENRLQEALKQKKKLKKSAAANGGAGGGMGGKIRAGYRAAVLKWEVECSVASAVATQRPALC
jgi:glycerate kinase